MTTDITSLDAHEQPSDELRAKWKAYSKTEAVDLSKLDIDDLRIPEKAAEFVVAGKIPAEQLRASVNHLSPDISSTLALEDAPIYYHPLLPGQ
jgi:meiotically up-regulated gene 157 (Mug157) protein